MIAIIVREMTLRMTPMQLLLEVVPLIETLLNVRLLRPESQQMKNMITETLTRFECLRCILSILHIFFMYVPSKHPSCLVINTSKQLE